MKQKLKNLYKLYPKPRPPCFATRSGQASALSPNQGFTIIEVVISLLIVAAGLVIYSSSANSVILNRNTRHQEIALRIAVTKIDDLRTTPFASLPASGSFTDPLLSSLPSGQANLTVSDLNSKTKQITVAVSWQESGSNPSHTVSLNTLITQGGLGQ